MKCKKTDCLHPSADRCMQPRLAFSQLQWGQRKEKTKTRDLGLQRSAIETSDRTYKPSAISAQRNLLGSFLQTGLAKRRTSKPDPITSTKKKSLHLSLFDLCSKFSSSNTCRSPRLQERSPEKLTGNEEGGLPSKELTQFEKDLAIYMKKEEQQLVFTNSATSSPLLEPVSSRSKPKTSRPKPTYQALVSGKHISNTSREEQTPLKKLIEGIRFLRLHIIKNKPKHKAPGKGLATGNSRSTHGTETDLFPGSDDDVRTARRFTSRLFKDNNQSAEGEKTLAADLIGIQGLEHLSRGRLATARPKQSQAGASSLLVN